MISKSYELIDYDSYQIGNSGVPESMASFSLDLKLPDYLGCCNILAKSDKRNSGIPST